MGSERYFEVSISDGKINHKTIWIEEDKGDKKLEANIFASLKEDGSFEEVVSWKRMLGIDRVNTIYDRRVIGKDEDKVVVLEILPEGEYFAYHSKPCCKIIREVSQKEMIMKINDLRNIANGQKLYRKKIEDLIDSSTRYYQEAKCLEPYYDKDKKIEEEKCYELGEGYYRVVLSDGVRQYKYIEFNKELKVPILAEYKNGSMVLIGLDICLNNINDISIISIDKDNYYYTKPCYVKEANITSTLFIKYINILNNNDDLLRKYYEDIQTIIYNGTHNTRTIVNKVDRKKVRKENLCKGNINNKKHLSRKKKKVLKKDMDRR